MGLCICLGLSVPAHAEPISLRFVVGDRLGQTDAQRRATQDKLTGFVGELNGYFRQSEVNLMADIVDVDFINIANPEAMEILAAMQAEQGGFSGLFGKAKTVGADYTFAVVDNLLLRGKRGCGRAVAVNQTLAEITDTRRAFAVIDMACGAHTLAHELGHLMGLNHGSLVDTCRPGEGHTTAITPYANGYGQGNCDGKPQPGEFGTLMVGGHMRAVNGDDHSSLPWFSNPRIKNPRCGAQGVCGDAQVGDAARALNENARCYAAHEGKDALRFSLDGERDARLSCLEALLRRALSP